MVNTRRMKLRDRRPVNYDEDAEPANETSPVSPPIPSLLNAIQEDQFKDRETRRRSRSGGRKRSSRPHGRLPTPYYMRPGFSLFDKTPLEFDTPDPEFAGITNLRGELDDDFGRTALGPVPDFGGRPFMGQFEAQFVRGDGRFVPNQPIAAEQPRPSQRRTSYERPGPTEVFTVPDDRDDDTEDAFPGPSKPRDQTVQAFYKSQDAKDQTFQKHLRETEPTQSRPSKHETVQSYMMGKKGQLPRDALKDTKDQTIQRYFQLAQPKSGWLPNWLIPFKFDKLTTSKSAATARQGNEQVTYPELSSQNAPPPTRPRARSASRSRPRGWLAPIWDAKYTLDAWLPWWWLRVPAALYLVDKWLWNLYLFFDPYNDRFGDKPDYLVLGLNTALITWLLRADRPFIRFVSTLFSWGTAVHGVLSRRVIRPAQRAAKWMCIIGIVYVIFLAHLAAGFVLWNFLFGSGVGGGSRSTMAEAAGVPRYMVKAMRMFGLPVP